MVHFHPKCPSANEVPFGGQSVWEALCSTGVCARALQLLSHSPRGFLGTQNRSAEWLCCQAGSAGVRVALSPAEDLLQQSPWCGNVPVLLPGMTQEVAQHCFPELPGCWERPVPGSFPEHTLLCSLFFLVLGLVPGLRIKSSNGFM